MPLYLKSHSHGEYVFDHAWADALERAGGDYYPKLQCCGAVHACHRATAADGDRTRRALILLKTAAAAVKQIGASSLHITFLTEDEWQAAGEAGYLLRTGQQFHWENRGYASFDQFLGELSSAKRKNLRKERAAVREAGVNFDWLTGSGHHRGPLGPVLRFLHGYGRAQMGHALSHPRFLLPHRRQHVAPDPAGDGASGGRDISPARSTCSAKACCSGATGARSNMSPSCISRPAITRRSISPSRGA